MNALSNMILKAVACGVVAVAVTATGSYAFVSSTAVARISPAQLVAKAEVSHMAKSVLTGLLQ